MPLVCSAQLEYAKWWWMENHMLDFTAGGAPVYGAGPGSMNTSWPASWGCGSICDKNGNLLFGVTTVGAFTSLGNLMPNGSFGLIDPDGEVLIVPKPCDPDIFYAVRTAQRNPAGGFSAPYGVYVTTIDLSLNGGLGDVVEHDTLDTNSFKHITVGRHANGKDYWVIIEDLTTGKEFNAYQVTDTGFSATPITSITSQAPYPTHSGSGGTGSLRLSPSTEYMVLSHMVPNAPSFRADRLFTFDNATGQLDFFCDLNDTAFAENGVAGRACFSPGETKLYITTGVDLWQFDLNSDDPDTIANSGVVLIDSNYSPAPLLIDMQIGLDGAIYMPRSSVHPSVVYNSIAVISDPDSLGAACNFVWDSITTAGPAYFGLPEIIYNLYVEREIQKDLLGCQGDTNRFSFDRYVYMDSVHWYVGDTSTAQQFFSNDSAAAFVIDSVGLYPITAYVFSACRTDTFTDTIEVIPAPSPNLGADTILCEGDTIDLFNQWYYSYLWNTGDTTEGIQILQPDTYWLALSNFCGSASDTVIIDSVIAALVQFPLEDTLMCDGDTLWLDATVDAGTYLWNTGFTGPLFPVTYQDTFWVQSQNACATSSDTLVARFTDVPMIPQLDSVLCNGDSLFLNLETDSLSLFVWYDGDSTAFDTITMQNTYWVEEWNLCGVDNDTFFVAFVNDPQTLLGNDTVLCIHDNLVLDATTPFGTYVWNTGDTSGAITIDESYLLPDQNIYSVTVYNACKSDTDQIIIQADLPLSPDLGDDLLLCHGDSLSLTIDSFPRTSYQWSGLPQNAHVVSYASSFQVFKEGSETITYGVSLTNMCGTFTDDVQVTIDSLLTPSLGADTVLCHGDSLLLRPGIFLRTAYNWQGLPPPFSSTATQQWVAMNHADSALNIKAMLSNACGLFTDSITILIDSQPKLYRFGEVYFCKGDSVEVRISKRDMDGLRWNDGYTDTVRSISQEREWEIVYTNHCGTSTQGFFTDQKQAPTIYMEEASVLCEDFINLEPDSVALEAGEFDWELEYLWTDGSTNTYLSIVEQGSYGLTVTNSFGCVDSARVEVTSCGRDWYLPNAFTPNSNGLNEYWKPVGEGIYSYAISIFDRWGNEVHRFTDQSPGWDGTVQGTPAQSGVYTYVMEIVSRDFKDGVLVNGTVVVIR